jgi:hypothetical protein
MQAIGAECGEVPQSLAEKGREFGLIHLARSHWERAMVDRAEAAGMAVDRHVVGRISERHRGAFLAQQSGKSGGIEGIAA